MSALTPLTTKEYQEQAGRTDPKDYSPVQVRVSTVEYMRLDHAAKGMVTEAGEFIDVLKKHSIYGKPIDRVNLKEELGDLMWYVALACNTLEIELGDVLAVNIAKLRARFPDKFTEEGALNRNLDAERGILEGGIKILVNGKEHLIQGKTIQYHQVVELALGLVKESTLVTVTYRGRSEFDRSGSLSAGQEPIKIEEGMIFNAAIT